jgi:hypothetical protein
LHPECYEQLTKHLKFDPPGKKLALPRFYMPEKQYRNDNPQPPPPPPELSQAEIEEIERRLATTDRRRRSIKPLSARILINGAERVALDLGRTSQAEIALEAGDSLIEVRGQDERGELLLATHMVRYTNSDFDHASDAASLNAGRLKFETTPLAVGNGPARASFRISFEPKLHWIRFWRGFVVLNPRGMLQAFAFGVMGIALILAFIVVTVYSHRLKVLEQKAQQVQIRQTEATAAVSPTIMSYRLGLDERRVRGAGGDPIPEISVKLRPRVVELQLPLAEPGREESYTAELKTFIDNQLLLSEKLLPQVRNGVVKIIIPTDALVPDTYYTVYLHSSERTDRYTFKIVDR